MVGQTWFARSRSNRSFDNDVRHWMNVEGMVILSHSKIDCLTGTPLSTRVSGIFAVWRFFRRSFRWFLVENLIIIVDVRTLGKWWINVDGLLRKNLGYNVCRRKFDKENLEKQKKNMTWNVGLKMTRSNIWTSWIIWTLKIHSSSLLSLVLDLKSLRKKIHYCSLIFS